MAEPQVKNQVCQACGADVRAGALFCYSCGSSVAPETIAALKDKKNIGEVWFREGLTNEKNGSQSTKIEQPIIEPPIVEQIRDKPIIKLPANEEPKLKSAAAMRRQSKIIQPKKVEVFWEEHENAPNGWFIWATIILTIFAAVILYLAMYLK